MRSPPTTPAPLAPEWSFVVQLRAGSSFDPADLCGRVEHVTSGQAGNFDSLEGLRLLMQRVLRRHGRTSSPAPGDDLDASR